jgi:signal transduction histidine kinase
MRGRLAWGLFVLIALCALGALVLHVLNADADAGELTSWTISTSSMGLAFGFAGALVWRRGRALPIGPLLVAVGLGEAVSGLTREWAVHTLATDPGSLPGGAVALWIGSWAWTAVWLLVPVFALFPDGRPASRGAAWVARAGMAAAPVAALLLAFGPGPVEGMGKMPFAMPDKPLGSLGFLPESDAVQPLLTLLFPAAVVVLVLRWRRASGVEVQQLKWFAFGAAVLVVQLLSNAWAGPDLRAIAGPLAVAAFASAIAVAILRHRLYDIDLVVSRTIAYAVLTGLVIGCYAGLVALLGLLFSGKHMPPLVAAALVAAAFAPVRTRVQSAVDRMLFGDRGDPYGVIERIGARLSGAAAPEQVLPALVEEIAAALKLPYVAIELNVDGRMVTGAEHGAPPAGPLIDLPLSFHGDPAGRLRLAPRSPGERLTRADRRLLDGIAAQAAVAVYAVRLSRDLQASRERLVTALEEERRRLRRDLHDGLGPALAGVTLQLAAARKLLERDPGAADGLIERAAGETEAAVADVRRLVYDLRPPSLDQLGLVQALRERSAQFEGVRVTVDVDRPLGRLPAAVEVAAYRIATEALTNVVRHSGAQTAGVRMSLNGGLELEVYDDGRGPGAARAGVGITSMRERAAELGGTCDVAERPGGGTSVRARLPVPA